MSGRFGAICLSLALVAALPAAHSETAVADFGYIQQWNGVGLALLLHNPGSPAVGADGLLRVPDTGADRIVTFLGNSGFVSVLGKGQGQPGADPPGMSGTGDSEFNLPEAVGAAPNGDFYVVDTGNNRIQQFTAAGGFVRRWGRNGGDGSPGTLPAEFSAPAGVGVDSAGNVYVSDRGNDRVQKFTATGAFVAQWGTTGSGAAELRSPGALAVGSTGLVFVADTDNNRIQVFDSTGSPVARWGRAGGDGTAGTGPGEFSAPRGVIQARNGIVYVADTANNRVQALSSDGAFLAAYGKDGSQGAAGTGNGEFSSPKGVAGDCRNSLYVADSGNDRIQRFGDPSFGLPPCLPPAAVSSGGSAVDSTSATLNGNVTTNRAPTRVRFEYGPSSAYGSTTREEQLPQGDFPVGVAIRVIGLTPRRAYHFRLVAANAEGVVVGEDQMLITPRLDPVLGPLRFRPARFSRVSTLTFTLSQSAKVRIAIRQLLPGRVSHSRCVADRRALRRHARCTRRLARGTLNRTGVAGLNRLAFGRRVGPRRLNPGRYVGTAVAVTLGALEPSATRSASFTVVSSR